MQNTAESPEVEIMLKKNQGCQTRTVISLQAVLHHVA